VLTRTDIDRFVSDGYLKLNGAFPRELADEARGILWRDTNCDPNDARTWTRSVIRLGYYHDVPFVKAANTECLREAFDALVGRGRWLPQGALGTFPVRFPSTETPGDTGWHVDPSFGYSDANFMNWRVNAFFKGRALLMLFLFSDVDEHDAPTRLRVGSHLDIARQLASAGDAGLTLQQLATNNFEETAHGPEVVATGETGTVFLCHPFLVHAAQVHRGTRPRFMAQPPLLSHEPLRLERDRGDHSPVENAIRHALGNGDIPYFVSR
jgi:hypothetical protein